MATVSLMLQLFVEQELAGEVTDAYPLEAQAFLLLDPSRNTVVREIECEKLGGILSASRSNGYSIGFAEYGFVTLSLWPSRGETSTDLYAPSHVSSPPFPGMGLAVLDVMDCGVSVDKPDQLSLARFLGAHAYVDQIDP